MKQAKIKTKAKIPTVPKTREEWGHPKALKRDPKPKPEPKIKTKFETPGTADKRSVLQTAAEAGHLEKIKSWADLDCGNA